ncbi:MAG: response regulator [Methylophilaceae bacterium]|nr:response regulator [Methylophilaceae bacterium]
MNTTNKGTVLIVDDEPPMRRLLCEYLEPEGYTVVTAQDGAEAWEILDRGTMEFDVLVTDRNMPRMNGLELLAKVKHDVRFKDLPVIFQTAHAAREEIVEGLRAGVYYYLAKPYDRLVLLALVAEAIEESRQRRELQEQARQHNRALDMLYGGEFRLRTLEDAKYLAPLLAQLSCDPARVVTGLLELLINAIEHGNLGITYAEKGELVKHGVWQQEVERRLGLPEYRDKFVLVDLLREPNQTTFTITDMGQGFDAQKYLTLDPDRLVHVHGRGIAISRMLSFDSVEYHGCGNQVVTVVRAAPAGRH